MATPNSGGYLRLSDEEFLRQMLAGENAAEPSAFAPLSVAGAPMNPSVQEPDVPGYTFTIPGTQGYAESFAEPGSTPEQMAAARAGTYSAINPLRSDAAYLAEAQEAQRRKGQRGAIEADI